MAGLAGLFKEVRIEVIESCANCRYSDPRIDDDGEPFLRCRRYPPIVAMLDEDEPMSVFSQTDADEWCGEWATTPSLNET